MFFGGETRSDKRKWKLDADVSMCIVVCLPALICECLSEVRPWEEHVIVAIEACCISDRLLYIC